VADKDCANVVVGENTKPVKATNARGMKSEARVKGEQLIELLTKRVVIHFVFIVFGEVVDCIHCNPVPRGTRNHPHEALPKVASLRLTQGSSWILEIA
jgi:hypothetical protein